MRVSSPRKSVQPSRLGLATSGGLMIVMGVIVAATIGKSRTDVLGIGDLLGGTLALALGVGSGGAMIWLACRYRILSHEELEALDQTPLPALSDDSLICRFHDLSGRVRRVVVDFEAQRIYFQNCHTQRKFLALPQTEFCCSFADLVSVERYQYRSDTLTIVTTTGKADVLSTAVDYERLCSRLPHCLPEQRLVADVEHPLMGVLYVAGALGGLFVGLALTPSSASAGSTGLLMAAGAGCGIALARILVELINATTGRSVVAPLAGSIIGAGVGLLVGSVIVKSAMGSGWIALIPAAIGAAAGILLGLARGRSR